MSWHYAREPGKHGAVYTDDGAPVGSRLDTLLRSGRPPLRAALELGAAIADILSIAEEDQVDHGDIGPEHVFIDQEGGVALGEWGEARRATRAPEAYPEGPLTDMYGLGLVVHSLLSDRPLGRLAGDPDAHDQAVIDRVLEMDFSQVSAKSWVDQVRRFLCTVLAYDPEDRPAPLDAANVLATVSERCPGSDLNTWARAALSQRASASRPTRPRAGGGSGEFGGPRRAQGPLQDSLPARRQAPSARGETTQMWTPERLAALLAEEDDEYADEPWDSPPAREPIGGDRPTEPGGWERTDDWREDQTWGDRPTEPPDTEPEWRDRPTKPRGDWDESTAPSPEPPPPPPAAAPDWRDQPPPPPPPPPPAPARPRSAEPAPPPPPPPGPVAWTPDQEPAAEGAESADSQGGRSPLVYVAGGLAVLFLLCLCGGGISGAVLKLMQDQPGDPVEIRTTPSDIDQPIERVMTVDSDDEPEPEPEDEPEPEPEAEPVREPVETRPQDRPTTPREPRATKRPDPEPEPVATQGYDVKIVLSESDRAAIRCGDGQSVEFTGAVRMSFESAQSCVITSGDAKGVVSVRNSGQATCGRVGSTITCAGP